jgi:hypothetical protein
VSTASMREKRAHAGTGEAEGKRSGPIHIVTCTSQAGQQTILFLSFLWITSVGQVPCGTFNSPGQESTWRKLGFLFSRRRRGLGEGKRSCVDDRVSPSSYNQPTTFHQVTKIHQIHQIHLLASFVAVPAILSPPCPYG